MYVPVLFAKQNSAEAKCLEGQKLQQGGLEEGLRGVKGGDNEFHLLQELVQLP